MDLKKKIYLIGCVFITPFILFECSSKKKENEVSKAVAPVVVQGVNRREDSRFVDNGDGTITDNYFGLMWEKEASGNMNWDEAVEYCRDVADAGGKKNWRLPTFLEFQNILNDTNSSCMLPSVFPRIGYQCTYHWTSGIVSPEMARIIDLHNAGFSAIHRDGRNGRGMTRCVKVVDPAKAARSQSLYVGPRFRNLENGLIQDTKTGFIWTKRLPVWREWEQAILYCQNLRTVASGWQTVARIEGDLRWRLPTKEELQEIIVNNHPNYPLGDLFRVPGEGGTGSAWTSTEISSSFAWGMSYGQIQKLLKRERMGVICISANLSPAPEHSDRKNKKARGDLLEQILSSPAQ